MEEYFYENGSTQAPTPPPQQLAGAAQKTLLMPKQAEGTMHGLSAHCQLRFLLEIPAFLLRDL